MRAEVHYSPVLLDELHLKDKNIVVIDVLRSSTTIATALMNGAKEIIPVNSVDKAVKISGSLYNGITLRGGEQNGKMIEGFNLGNSPSEYTEAVVKGKSIVYISTNGSVAIVKGRYAKNLFVATFVNISSVVQKLEELKSDFLIVCAAKENWFSLEDAVCAGKIVNKLAERLKDNLEIDDGGAAAVAMDNIYGNDVLGMLRTSEHGKYLIEIGFEKDLKYCAQLDTVPVVPVFSGSALKLPKESKSAARTQK